MDCDVTNEPHGTKLPFALDSRIYGRRCGCRSVCRVLVRGSIGGALCSRGRQRARSDFTKGGAQDLQAVIYKATMVIGSVLLLYFFAISWIGSFFVEWLYGTEYAGHQDLLIPLAASVVVTAIALGPSKGFSVLEFPNLNFLFNLIGLVSIALFAFLLGSMDGLRGAVWGLFLGSAVPTMLKWIWYRRIISVHGTKPRISQRGRKVATNKLNAEYAETQRFAKKNNDNKDDFE